LGKKIAVSLGVILSISLIPILVDDVFAGVPDPVQLGDFKCYDFKDIDGAEPERDLAEYPLEVDLVDQQFGQDAKYQVDISFLWCNPAIKGDGWPSSSPTPDVEQHYKPYNVCDTPAPDDNCQSLDRVIRIHDQFGSHSTIVLDPVELWVPADKSEDPGSFEKGFAQDKDTHYLCYNITPYGIQQDGLVQDQFFEFGNEDDIGLAFKFCTPVDKTFEGDTVEHNNPKDLVCYTIDNEIRVQANFQFNTTDQLDKFDFDDGIEHSLCVVANKAFPVGGTVLLPDSVSLLILEAESSAIWWLPAVLIAGAGVTLFKIKKKN